MNKTNEDGLTEAQWYQRADHACLSISGLTLGDLPDGPSYDAWADGVPPAEYARMILEEEGFPFEDERPTAAEVRSQDIRTGPTIGERLAEGRHLTNAHIRLVLDQRKTLGHLPVLY